MSISAIRGVSTLALVVLVLGGCGQAAGGPPGASTPALTESLIFSGAVSGALNVALNQRPAVSINPRMEGGPPRSTRCADFFATKPSGNRDHLYEADIVGKVGGVRYGFDVQVSELALTPIPGDFPLSLGAYSRGDVALMTSDGIASTQWYRTAGMIFPSSFTVDDDLTSGTVDVGLAAGPQGSVVHITGSWRCA